MEDNEIRDPPLNHMRFTKKMFDLIWEIKDKGISGSSGNLRN